MSRPGQWHKNRAGSRASRLETVAHVLSHAFPGVAPLFPGCRAFYR
jgi:uncharacterized membrane protein YjjB (DUF3815 family)